MADTKQKLSLAERAESIVDRAIGFFMPRREIVRRLDRMNLRRVRSMQYAAAKTDRLTGGWNPVNENVNTLIGNSWSTVTARVRQLVRDFPYFARAVDVITDYVVGQGIMFQSRIRNDDGTLNKTLNQRIEDAFNFWADEADISGKLHYYEIMALCKRQDIECGEFLLIKRESSKKGRFIPFCLQLYEPDWLTDHGAKPVGANKVERGIEYDKFTGEVMAYHFTNPDSWGKTIRISADSVIHKFKTLRPGQLRGITPFASGVLLADDLHNLMQSEIDAAKMASKYLAFVYTDNPAGRQINMTTDDDNKKIDEMENAIVEYLRTNEKIEIASNPRPSSTFEPAAKFILTMLAVTTGVPFELLSGIYAGLNYSVTRTKRNDFNHELKPISTRHIRHFALPTYYPFIESAVMHGKLDLPYFFSNPAMYLRNEWQPPGMESIDPLRETKAHVDQINALLRSPQEIVRARGRELDDVLREIKEATDMASGMGLSLGTIDTSLANNPAAIGAGEDDDEGERTDGRTKAEIIKIITGRK